MMKSNTKITRRFLWSLPFLFLVSFFVLFTVFEYTLVADIRESFSDTNKTVPVSYGETLFVTRGCNGCHSLEVGEAGIGPGLAGIANSKSTEYLRTSIQYPNAVIVKGYSADIMPDYGKILEPEQIEALVEYLSTLK